MANIKAQFNDLFFKKIRFGNPALEFLVKTEIETAQVCGGGASNSVVAWRLPFSIAAAL